MFESKTMKKLLTILMLLPSFVYAQNTGVNIAIPNAPQSFQSDRVRAGDVECSAAIGSSTNVEFGVVGILNQNDPMYQFSNDPTLNYNQDEFLRDIGVYGRITIPIGAPKKRLNCNRLYELELEKKRLEVLKLQREIQMLKNLQFEAPTAGNVIANGD
jgi:hypothetical protein